ncbi:CTU1 protein, partial [Bucco capensis]|nr:CTU1 protein [Bucco capensis]
MAAPRCRRCPLAASLLRPRTSEPLCRRCFLQAFEAEILLSLTGKPLLGVTSGAGGPFPTPGSTIAVAASGGKDSTVLSKVLSLLDHRRHPEGYHLVLLAIDEGIQGYREEALGSLRRSRGDLPLLILSHQELFGWSVDEVGKGLGKGSRCTFCGVFRRQALERGARLLGVDWIATGFQKLSQAAGRSPKQLSPPWAAVPRCKPLRHAYEKEIVLYAHFQGLPYFSTECLYAPHAYRGHARNLLKDLEATRTSTVAALGHSGRRLEVATEVATKALGACERCGFASSQALCKACVLLASL